MISVQVLLCTCFVIVSAEGVFFPGRKLKYTARGVYKPYWKTVSFLNRPQFTLLAWSLRGRHLWPLHYPSWPSLGLGLRTGQQGRWMLTLGLNHQREAPGRASGAGGAGIGRQTAWGAQRTPQNHPEHRPLPSQAVMGTGSHCFIWGCLPAALPPECIPCFFPQDPCPEPELEPYGGGRLRTPFRSVV